jgi:hypothetical protein
LFFLVCDGLKGLSEVASKVWPLTTVQSLHHPLCQSAYYADMVVGFLAMQRFWAVGVGIIR